MDKKYLAGFFDGEGDASIGIFLSKNGKRIYLIPRMRIGNTNQEVIEEIKKFLQMQNYKLYKSNRTNKTFWALGISGFEQILRFINLVEEDIIVKRKHLEILKRFCERRILLKKKKIAEIENFS